MSPTPTHQVQVTNGLIFTSYPFYSHQAALHFALTCQPKYKTVRLVEVWTDGRFVEVWCSGECTHSQQIGIS